ncbi:RraA family protein [Streptomyces sp. NPDC005962]|uniref:RraA family protein n=1 Tax=Streptomyces sp. NPDC005962 TaxID=3154466 RepID=UPI0033F50138
MTDAARGHSTATLYEASSSAARPCDSALRAAWPGARLAGPAFTVQGIGGDNLALHRAVATAPPGSVLVVDLQGARHGHWGEILAVAAQQRGILGLVVDGGVRDTAEQAELDFPVFARHVTVVGTGKEHPGQFDVPVRVADVVVHPGDLIVGDADGVVVVPVEAVAKTLGQSDDRVAAEQRALEAIRGGVTTLEYYTLPSGSETSGPRT